VNALNPRRRRKRGYLMAILLRIEEEHATILKIFSKTAKLEKIIHVQGATNNPKTPYNFYEEIINTIRPTLKEGVRSIILVASPRNNSSREFLNHIHEHHKWLNKGPNRVTISKIVDLASTPSQLLTFARTEKLRKIVSDTASEETENLIEILEKRLIIDEKKNYVLFSIEEIEDSILKRHKLGRPKPDYLLLTNRYLGETHDKNRLHRLMQIATNKKVKTRIIDAESPAGNRLTQLGGIVCLAKIN
jgi:stalled ribosome rescue protein Dom34